MEFAQYANTEMMIAMLSVLDDFEKSHQRNCKKWQRIRLERRRIDLSKIQNTLSDKGLKQLK